jgi:hypothetical protein
MERNDTTDKRTLGLAKFEELDAKGHRRFVRYSRTRHSARTPARPRSCVRGILCQRNDLHPILGTRMLKHSPKP